MTMEMTVKVLMTMTIRMVVAIMMMMMTTRMLLIIIRDRNDTVMVAMVF